MYSAKLAQQQQSPGSTTPSGGSSSLRGHSPQPPSCQGSGDIFPKQEGSHSMGGGGLSAGGHAMEGSCCVHLYVATAWIVALKYRVSPMLFLPSCVPRFRYVLYWLHANPCCCYFVSLQTEARIYQPGCSVLWRRFSEKWFLYKWKEHYS